MMNRLTQRIGVNGEAILISDMEEKFTAEELIDILLARLADYEDTGYSPSGVVALADNLRSLQSLYAPLMLAREEGRLVEHPCKDGDPVWEIEWCGKIIKGYRCPYGCSGGQRERVFCKKCIPYCEIHKTGYQKYMLDRIGDTVFLSEKDAKKRLQEKARAKEEG